MRQGTGVLRNWYWIWLVTGFLVGSMAVIFFCRPPHWFRLAFHGFNLAREMNYAVWWSGSCLFLAGIVFARVGEIAGRSARPAWPWYILGLAMLALCFDEVGSLHESVARVYGWWGLLPFALAFAVGFACSLFSILRQPAFRPVVLMVVISVGMFGFVAVLEALEHNLVKEDLPAFIQPYWGRVRMLFEEGSELVAIALLVTSGLLSVKLMGEEDRRFLRVVSVVERLLDVPLLMFLLFVLQMVIASGYIVVNYHKFPEGNPVVLFPMLLYFCLGIIARLRAAPDRASDGHRRFWVWLAIIFFVASALQMYNFHQLFSLATGVTIGLLESPSVTLLIATMPLLFMAGFGIRNKLISTGDWLRPLFLLLTVFTLVFPDLDHPQRAEFHGLLFSSVVVYACYQLLGRFEQGLGLVSDHLPNSTPLSKVKPV